MPKGSLDQDVGVATSLTALRDRLHELEVQASNLRGYGQRIVDVLRLRDSIEGEMQERVASGYDVRAESTRLQTIDNMLRRQGSLIVTELTGYGGLARTRQEVKPPEAHWWWFLDYEVGERRRKVAIRSTIIVVAVMTVLIVGNFVMNRFFGLDPVEKEARGYATQADQLVMRGDVSEAIPYYEQAVATLPEYGEAHANLAVLYESVGRAADAEREHALARQYLGSEEQYLLTVARAYQGLSNLEAAMARIEQVIAANPDSAEGYLTRGGLYEAMQKTNEAIADFEKAGQLASDQGQDALYVLARTRMAMLLQRSPSMGMGGF